MIKIDYTKELAKHCAGIRFGDGTVIGTTLSPLSQYAALANAASSHAMSLDDICTPASIHPDSGIFAASWAAVEWTGADGERFIEGVVAGYEATIGVAEAVGSKEHTKAGFDQSQQDRIVETLQHIGGLEDMKKLTGLLRIMEGS